jgi:hypothetical protein
MFSDCLLERRASFCSNHARHAGCDLPHRGAGGGNQQVDCCIDCSFLLNCLQDCMTQILQPSETLNLPNDNFMPTNNPKTSLFKHQRAAVLLAVLSALVLTGLPAKAQIDPAPRQILHAGFDTSLKDQGPFGAYLFYYWNIPHVINTNQFLRLAIAPVYVDGELGFKSLLGENTDFAVGAFGGLYANSYQEVDAGNWRKDESFDGNGGGVSASIYHRFNPDQQIPLTGVLRARMNYLSFDDTSDTGNTFELPQNQPTMTYRAGLRWGGKEPYLAPTLGMEISSWYELEQRTDSSSYGYNNDRRMESMAQRIFGRAQINYTTLKSKHYIMAGLQGGGTFNSDRLSCYRLGGVLPYTKEFPLTIPGYYFQEISAKDFGLAYGAYTIPLGPEGRWSWINSGAAAVVKYQEGTGQPGTLNSGVGTGIQYSAESRRWKVISLFGYGFQAMRGDDRGGYSLGVAFQYNFGSTEYASQRAYEELQQANGVTR